MAKIPFNVDAYTARLIGRENVSKLEGAVIELVKNTYDADAACCILYYDEKNNAVFLADNGCGMTEPIIKEHWMTIGHSSKKKTFISQRGRIQTGEKGIGRFALDRIADSCQMITGTINSSRKLLWEVDWNSFSSGKNITEIGAELKETDITFEDFLSECHNRVVIDLIKREWKQSGTIFKLTNLRDNWNDKLLSSMRESLASLIPYELSSVYKIYCFGNSSTEDDAEVFNNLDAFSYDYKIEFSVDKVSDNKKSVQVNLWRNEYSFGPNEDEILKKLNISEEKEFFHGTPMSKEYLFSEIVPGISHDLEQRIGSFSGVLYFSKRNQLKKERERFYQKDITGRMDVRDTFGGIKIYRDNFRVRPYGDPKTSAYDWLQLSRRKAGSPAGPASKGVWRVNADQMLGSIFISRINATLPDRSNREGIVETPEFLLLQEFLKGILNILEKDRQYVFRLLAALYNMQHPAEQIQKEINSKADKQHKRKELSKCNPESNKNENEHCDITVVNSGDLIDPEDAKIVLDAKDEQIEDLENENKMLRVLATTGIVTNTYIHEFKTLLHKLSMKIVMAKDAIEKDGDIEDADDYINQADEIRKDFNSWFQVTIEAVKKDKRKRRKTNIVNVILKSIESWNKTLNSKHIEIIYEGKVDSEIYLRCFPYEIDTIVSNLITNSTASFDKIRTKEKKIYIEVREEKGYVIIDYSDTGAGLEKIYKNNPEKTLEVFESDKRDSSGQMVGTGMGLWIVNNTVMDYDGKIDLSKNKTEQTGYFITLFLKQTGESKDV